MPGFFDDNSMLRVVHRERAIALSGPRALLMQAAHPLAVSGLLAHSTAMDEPYDRLARTAEVMSTIGFGEAEEAERITTHVRAMHAKVSGRLREPTGRFPAGHPLPRRSARPPAVGPVHAGGLRAWWSIASTCARCRAREEEAYWEDYKLVGNLFGLADADMPDTLDDLHDYKREMLEGDTLLVTDWARKRAKEIVMEPPVPWVARPLLETANFITIALLPGRIRREYGFFPLPPTAVRKALVAGGAEYVKRAVIPFLPDRLRYVPAARAA